MATVTDTAARDRWEKEVAAAPARRSLSRRLRSISARSALRTCSWLRRRLRSLTLASTSAAPSSRTGALAWSSASFASICAGSVRLPRFVDTRTVSPVLMPSASAWTPPTSTGTRTSCRAGCASA